MTTHSDMLLEKFSGQPGIINVLIWEPRSRIVHFRPMTSTSAPDHHAYALAKMIDVQHTEPLVLIVQSGRARDAMRTVAIPTPSGCVLAVTIAHGDAAAKSLRRSMDRFIAKWEKARRDEMVDSTVPSAEAS